MPRVHKRVARNNIYDEGIRVPSANTKSGYRRDRSKPADEQDELLVQKGQKYYTWKFRYGGERISLTYPKRQQLTQSEHQTWVYDTEDAISELSNIENADDFRAEVESIISDIESYKDDLQYRLEGMPEQLQDSSVLNERIEALENAIDKMNGIDLDYDEPETDDILARLDESPSEDEIEAEREEMMREWVAEKFGELEGISLE